MSSRGGPTRSHGRPHRAAARALAAAVAFGALALPACEDPLCEEDIRAQVIDDRVEIELTDLTLLAELADDPVERDRGWKHRRCDREAILLIPDSPPAELSIWGCGLFEAVDAAFIADGVVSAIERIEPCAEPCAGCPQVGGGASGEAVLVDAVLELPAGIDASIEVGDAVSYALP